MLFVNAFGRKLYHLVGSRSVPEMHSILSLIPADMTQVYGLLWRLRQNPDSMQLNIAIGDAYRVMRMPQVINEY